MLEQSFNTREVVERFLQGLTTGTSAQIEQNIHHLEGALEKLIPGFARLKGCEQALSHHAEGDVLVHTAKVFAQAVRLGAGMSRSDNYAFIVSALLHDIEKPSTRAEVHGKITFRGHAERAAARSSEFAKVFHMTSVEERMLDFLIRHHMAAHEMPSFGEKARLELYKSPHFSALALLQEADARSAWRKADGSEHCEVLADFFASDRVSLLDKESAAALEQLLYSSARDTLKELGVKPGPYFGEMRMALKDAVAHGALVTRANAVTWAQEYYVAQPPV